MATSSVVHVRLDEKIKIAATETLASMGLSVSDAVRVFLTRVALEKALPFEVKVPNTEAQRQAMLDIAKIASENAELNKNVPAEEMEFLIAEAVTEVRQNRKNKNYK